MPIACAPWCSRRALGVLRPLRVVITNLPDSHYEEVEAKASGGH